ncbi:MAG: hypothetical protein OEY09_09435 [Gammaproteobacteria bacterium]|nr:hypothetical protein [Gammaproteobacteria bacterium]
MTFRRKLSFLAVIGIVVLFSTKGFHFSITNNMLSVFLSPWTLLSWPLLLIPLITSLNEKSKGSEELAPWWRGAVAFLIDGPLLMSIFAIPLCLLVLVLENGGIPSSWLIERKAGTSKDTLYTILFLFMFIATWSGIGLCLHPKITTPGALAANVTLKVKGNLPAWRLAFFGVFAYYGVFIPFFKHFAIGVEVEKHIRAA